MAGRRAGLEVDRRAGVSDICDPRQLNPVLVLLQELDASETERRRQRNRILELAIPAAVAASRLATVMAAGGRLLQASPDRCLHADPDGNELALVGEGPSEDARPACPIRDIMSPSLVRRATQSSSSLFRCPTHATGQSDRPVRPATVGSCCHRTGRHPIPPRSAP